MTLVAITRAQRDKAYGPMTWYGPNVGVVAERLRSMPTPWGTKVTVHELVASHWAEAMEVAAAEVPEFRPRRTDSFVPRLIRASTAISMHAYGLAIDFFTTPYPTPPPGGVWTPLELRTPEAAAFRAVFARYGFRLGADFTRVDLPHIEWAAAPPTTRPPDPPPPAVIVPPARPEETDDMGATIAQLDTLTAYGPVAVALDGLELRALNGGRFVGSDIDAWRVRGLDGTPVPDVIDLSAIPIVGRPTDVLRLGVTGVAVWTRDDAGRRYCYAFQVGTA